MNSEQKARAVSEASEEPSGAEVERSRAHFYVLCPAVQCGGGMRPGKLRVRCSECGEGAVVVHRDPCDWDDVLVAGRVTGTCSNAACDTADATVEFYFKVQSTSGSWITFWPMRQSYLFVLTQCNFIANG